ncbi:hypothetical protein BGW41_006261, partial [Actinomortierella wolfii]
PGRWGYVVIGVNEYYSSKKCPAALGLWQGTKSMRCQYRGTYQEVVHRDAMAGHSLCNVMRVRLEKGERPDYLLNKAIIHTSNVARGVAMRTDQRKAANARNKSLGEH